MNYTDFTIRMATALTHLAKKALIFTADSKYQNPNELPYVPVN